MLFRILYRTFIRLYILILHLAAPFRSKARLMLEGRKRLLGEVSVAFKRVQEPVAWFHCASLGEFEQGRPVMEGLRERYPEYKILITFFSPSGYEVRKNYLGADFVYYLPFDLPVSVRAFVAAVHPAMVVVVKYEFWYFLLHCLSRRHVPLFLISGIFRPGQVFFRPWGRLYRSVLHTFTHLFVQDEKSRDLLRGIGILNVTVSGDTRFDRVYEISRYPQIADLVEEFCAGAPVMVVGSLWPEDLRVLLPLIREAPGGLKFVIAPHEVEEGGIRRLVQELGEGTLRYSTAGTTRADAFRILVIDNVGMLSSLYRFGVVAYVGGAFGEGLHNILEPAACGVPVFFGRSRSNAKYREAGELLAAGGAFEVSEASELRSGVRRLLEDPAEQKRASEAGLHYVLARKGATSTILNGIDHLLQHVRRFGH